MSNRKAWLLGRSRRKHGGGPVSSRTADGHLTQDDLDWISGILGPPVRLSAEEIAALPPLPPGHVGGWTRTARTPLPLVTWRRVSDAEADEMLRAPNPILGDIWRP